MLPRLHVLAFFFCALFSLQSSAQVPIVLVKVDPTGSTSCNMRIQINFMTGTMWYPANPVSNVCTWVQKGGGGNSVGSSDLTSQTSSQTTVTLVASTIASGKFRISYYADQNALCDSGQTSVFFSFQWTDASHSRTASTVVLVLPSTQSANLGSIQGVIPIYAAMSTAITYTSTVTGSCSAGGPSSYDVHISVESIQ